MQKKSRSQKAAFLAAVLMFSLSPAKAVVLWTESVGGDLSNNQAAPTPFTLTLGVNSIIGSVQSAADARDWIALTVPAGFQLSSLVLASYTSTDAQGFTGVQSGSSFVGNAGTATPYLGYAHYGTGAVNGALPPTNLVGVDLLPIMGNTTLAAGSQGFTPPLPSGIYTFLIQQTGSALTSYQFNYTLSAVPEPGTLALLTLGGVVLLHCKRRSAHALF